ncbi:MAG: primase-helicase family protein [Allorhizobium sp.]
MNVSDLTALFVYQSRLKAENGGCEFYNTSAGFKVTRTEGQYPQEVARVRINKANGRVTVAGKQRALFKPSEGEETAIRSECERVSAADGWDKLFPLASLDGTTIPEPWANALQNTPHHFWEYRNAANKIEMIEYRHDDDDGKKFYRRATYWEDTQGHSEWREDTEPDVWPFFGGEQINTNNTIFYVFEGPKAAAFVQRLITPKTEMDRPIADAHPWTQWFRDCLGVAVGWGGGAKAVGNTDWSQLNKSGNTVYIFADRDVDGAMATGEIAKKLRKATVFRVDFDDRFNGGWDCADELPPAFWEKQEDGTNKFVGPELENFVSFGAWLTEIDHIDENGKVFWKLTAQAEKELVYVATIDRFTTRSRPWEAFEFTAFNRKYAHSSDCQIAPLVIDNAQCVFDGTDYLPGKGRAEVRNGQKVLNTWTGANIRPVAPRGSVAPGDHVRPFLDLLDAMVPDEAERKTIVRWLATVIGKPERRVLFALLMISTVTGLGKTTIAERILKPLLGFQNVSFATRTDIEGQFTGWLANRRLVVVSELYAAGSHKLLSRLKEFITDETIRFNEKNQRAFDVHNAAHFYLSSNSYNAVHIDSVHERRLFVPRLAEVKPDAEIFLRLFHFLESDNGLGKILWWAQNYGDYIANGAAAPLTERKREMLADSRTEAETRLLDVANAIADENYTPLVVGSKEVATWAASVANAAGERFAPKETAIRKMLVDAGLIDLANAPELTALDKAPDDKRWLPLAINEKFAGKQYPLANKSALVELRKAGSKFDDFKEAARAMHKPFAEIEIAA